MTMIPDLNIMFDYSFCINNTFKPILAFGPTCAPCITMLPSPMIAFFETYAFGDIIFGNLNSNFLNFSKIFFLISRLFIWPTAMCV